MGVIIGVLEKKMETTILGFGFWGLGFGVFGLGSRLLSLGCSAAFTLCGRVNFTVP